MCMCMCMQITALEKNGGTILGGAFKLLRDRKKNPGPPRDPSLPPKPKGQTVGSFTGGLRMLPDAIARKMQSKLRCQYHLQCCMTDLHLLCSTDVWAHACNFILLCYPKPKLHQ